MHGQMLGIYLNDHLAGSTAGVGLARRIARAHRRTPRGPELARLANEIAQDRHDLLAIMHSSATPRAVTRSSRVGPESGPPAGSSTAAWCGVRA